MKLKERVENLFNSVKRKTGAVVLGLSLTLGSGYAMQGCGGDDSDYTSGFATPLALGKAMFKYYQTGDESAARQNCFISRDDHKEIMPILRKKWGSTESETQYDGFMSRFSKCFNSYASKKPFAGCNFVSAEIDVDPGDITELGNGYQHANDAKIHYNCTGKVRHVNWSDNVINTPDTGWKVLAVKCKPVSEGN